MMDPPPDGSTSLNSVYNLHFLDTEQILNVQPVFYFQKILFYVLFGTPPGRAKGGWAGCILIFGKIQIYMNKLGPENATYLDNSCYYSLLQLLWQLC